MIAKHKFAWFRFTSFLTLGLAMCADNDLPEVPAPSVAGTTSGSISNILANNDRFTVISALLERSGLLDDLDGAGDFTVFAPTDAAFAAMPNSFISAANFVSTGNPAQLVLGEGLTNDGLRAVLEAHVVSESVAGEDVVDGVELTTLASSPLNVVVVGATDDLPGLAILNGRARVVQTDLAPSPSNGVIHVIDSVLVPEVQLASAGVLDEATYPGTVAELVEATPLYETIISALRDGGGVAGLLSSFNDAEAQTTLIVPTVGIPTFDVESDDVEAASEATISSRSFGNLHVFEGELDGSSVAAATTVSNMFGARFAVVDDDAGLSVGGSSVLVTDVLATNGRVHVVGAPLEPLMESAADILGSRSELSSLLAALEDTGLAESLGDTTTVRTVFAPTNDAFDAFDALGINPMDENDPGIGLLEQLTTAGELENLLLYHVSADDVVEVLALPDPEDPTDMRPPLPMSIETLLTGESVSVAQAEGADAVTLNDEVGIVSTDVIDVTPEDEDDAAFIVVHTIDGVLIPDTGVTVPAPPEAESP